MKQVTKKQLIHTNFPWFFLLLLLHLFLFSHPARFSCLHKCYQLWKWSSISFSELEAPFPSLLTSHLLHHLLLRNCQVCWQRFQNVPSETAPLNNCPLNFPNFDLLSRISVVVITTLSRTRLRFSPVIPPLLLSRLEKCFQQHILIPSFNFPNFSKSSLTLWPLNFTLFLSLLKKRSSKK